MKPRTVGALSISKVATSDTSGPACCPVEKCYGMALWRLTILGYPAGHLCGKCANAALKMWAELLEPEQEMELAA